MADNRAELTHEFKVQILSFVRERLGHLPTSGVALVAMSMALADLIYTSSRGDAERTDEILDTCRQMIVSRIETLEGFFEGNERKH